MVIIARPYKSRCICALPKHASFAPEGSIPEDTGTIGLDEYEVIRQMDYLHLSQQQCAARLGVSRATVARMYAHARAVIAEALVLGKRLRIEGGDVTVCLQMKPECANEPHCCHRQAEIRGGEKR